MLYVIYGTDTQKSRRKLSDLIESLQKKRPDASLFRLTSENWNEGALDELIQGQGLFLPKYIIVLDQLLAGAESKEVVMDRIKELHKAEHICILFEEKIKAADLKILEKNSEKIQEYGEVKETKKEAPKTFALSDAISMKDSKKAWMVFQELMQEGAVAEEIHGVLWWQFKSIFLASKTRSAKEAGLAPFVYQKSSRAAGVWTGEELDKVLEKLFVMYHKAHRGEIEFNLELERFLLAPLK